MSNYLYARVSSAGQNLDSQVEALTKKYPDAEIYTETKTGTNTDRPVFQKVMHEIGKGDKLVITKLDRLARSTLDLLSIVETLEKRGANLEILDQAIDTSTAAGKAFLQMLGVFAEFETNIRKERQQAGIELAKEQGKYRKDKKITDDDVENLLSRGYSTQAIADIKGVSKSTIHRAKRRLKATTS